MANQRVDQVCFVQGQLDPRVQTRVDWADYYKSAAELTNCIVIPQGGVTRRWGTTYVDVLTTTNPDFCELSTFKYNADAQYLLLWEANFTYVYFENLLIQTIPTQYANEDIATLRFSQAQNRIIITTGNYQPQQIVRSGDAMQAITAFGANTLTAAIGYAAGLVLPVQFATTGALPTTSPQIFAMRDYFIRTQAGGVFQVFSSSTDAINNVNAYTVTALGNNSTVSVQNTWTVTNIAFKFTPAYDFNSNYFGVTFTPSAVSGSPVTITSSAAIPFTNALIGGLFEGNGGSLRIVGVTSPTIITGYTIEPFVNVTAIQGALCFLGEPAWSATRLWPSTSTYIQNRLFFANTPFITNGVWGSVINDFYNFDNSLTTADYTLESFVSSGDPTFIQSMTSTRSLIVHTITGSYSTPVQSEAPLIPATPFIEQNKFGVSELQPVFIDNQIFFVDGSSNSIINMIWEFSQSSYVTNNISIKANGLINNPVDMAAFTEPDTVDGFYVIFVNSDGTLCVLQTLHEENITAFTPGNTNTYLVNNQQNGYDTLPAQYVKVATSQNRCWFAVKRQQLNQTGVIAITGFNPANNTLTAMAHGIPLGIPTRINFGTAGNLPTTVPQVELNVYYFAIAIDANTFQTYGSEADAAAAANVYVIDNAGAASVISVWAVASAIWIEEANFDYYTDASITITNNVPQTVITGLEYLNGQVVQCVADGYVTDAHTVVNGEITLFIAASVVQVGLAYTSTLQPLPPVIPGIPGMLYQPKHIRDIYISYYETIGATVQGYGIPIQNLQQVILGAPPVPETGTWEYTPMQGWGGASPDPIVISQSAPLPMTILSLSYVLEI